MDATNRQHGNAMLICPVLDAEDASGDPHGELSVRMDGDELSDAERAAVYRDQCHALARWVLRSQATEIRDDQMDHLVAEIAGQVDRVTDGMRLGRFAGPDVRAPESDPVPAISDTTLALSELFKRWKAETQPSGSTVMTWGGVIRALAAFLGHDDATRVTTDVLIRWKDQLLAKGLRPKTIRDQHLACLKSVFNFAIANRLVRDNPVVGMKISVKARAGERRLPYNDDEVARLIDIARHQPDAARKFLVMLVATSGARVGEIAQLWGSRIRVEGGFTVMHLAPAEDGGSLKNEGSERTVPIHPAVLAEGFMAFVNSKGEGPLFYRRSSGSPARRHASKGVANHLATWIRVQGFTDPRKAPAHSLRHWWKSKADEVGLPERLADVLQGHAPKSEGDDYRRYSIRRKAEALSRIALPQLSIP